MKFLYYLFLFVNFFQPLYSNFYINSLDATINQQVKILAGSSYEVESIVHKIKRNIKKKVSLQEIDTFLHHESSIAFFFCDEIQSKLNNSLAEDPQIQQSFEDLQFGLGVKLFLYYLECCKQKMMYKAVKNYDTLNFWKNEKFNEDRSSYNINMYRWLLGSSYREEVMRNITQLEEISRQTNYFLGIVRYSQHLLEQAITQQECKERLLVAVKLQDDFLHIQDQEYDSCEIGNIVTSSIDKVYRFSLYLSEQYVQCQMPSHIRRSWKAYTLTVAAAYVSGFIYLHYGNEIIHSSQHFWDEHIQGALKRNIKAFAGIAQGPQIDVEKDKKALLASVQQALKDRESGSDKPQADLSFIKDYCTTDLSWWAKYYDVEMSWFGRPFSDDPEVSRREIFYNRWSHQLFGTYLTAQPENKDEHSQGLPQVDITNQIVADKLLDMPTLAQQQDQEDRDCQVIAKPLENVIDLVPAVTRMTLRKSIDLGTQANHLLQDVHIVLGLTALIPMLTVIGGSLFASKTMYNSVAYQPIRTLVNRLEVFLNESLYKSMMFDCEGYLYFLTEQLKLNVGVLTFREQKLIEADIIALQNYDLDYAQKFNIVQRMYRTYPCLVPVTI